jgi:MFS family permease
LGLIGFANSLPMFFLALPGGVLVEHLDKRKTVIVMQTIMMLNTFALAFLTLSGIIQIWHIIITSLILGVATAFEITARQAMLIEIVGREALPNAIPLQATAFNLSRMLGPVMVMPLAWLLPDNWEGWAFFLNGVSFVTIVTGLFFVRTLYKAPVEPRTRPMLEEFREGARYLVNNSSVGLLVVIAAVLGVFAFPLILQLPVVSKDLLGQIGDTKNSVDTRNSLLYMSQGIGALIAAFSIAVNNSAHRRGLRLLLGEAAFIFGILLLPFSRSVPLTMLIIATMGWGSVTQLATMNTLLQLHVPDTLRGRVFSIYLWALQGVAPFGSLFVGWMTQQFQLATTALICGTISLVIISGVQIFNPGIRQTAA